MKFNPTTNYSLVTGAYWIFTLTDGALRMLVLLYFYSFGYDAFEIALLFLFYELAGIFTNLIGGWIGARLGLKSTLLAGLFLQVVALSALANINVDWPIWKSIGFVMAMQALSGVAKDLTKMSSKSAVKLVIGEGKQQVLFKWVAVLTGSKNALKGIGFFIGGFLLTWLGFSMALYSMAIAIIFAVLLAIATANLGKSSERPKLAGILSKEPKINILSGARFFLFGARDIWFVVGLPIFLAAELGWSHTEIGSYMAFWIIGYGIVQAIAPKLVIGNEKSATYWIFILMMVTTLMAFGIYFGVYPSLTILLGLVVFGIIFAINSSIHSFLILNYSKNDQVLLNVGFYYMANAGGRLVGTLISGLTYQLEGILSCLLFSLLFLSMSWLITSALSRSHNLYLRD